MSPGRPSGDQFGDGDYEDEAPRSIFASTWFRALIVVAALAVIAVLALPYILEWIGPSLTGRTVSAPVLSAPSPPSAVPTPGPSPTETPAAPAAMPTAPKPAPAEKSRPGPVAAAPMEGATPAKTAQAEGKKAREEPKAERAKAARAKAPAAKSKPAAAAVRSVGAYFVQVGAFRDERLAKALVAKLRAENFPVVEMGPDQGAPSEAGIPEPPVGASDRYDVFVAGASSADVNAKLSKEGLSADAVAGGAIIKPSLPLRDAVALSKDLANAGFKVQVRRATAGAGAERAAPRPAAAAGDGLYRVRVGGFPGRGAAEEARKSLVAKGYPGFIARSGG